MPYAAQEGAGVTSLVGIAKMQKSRRANLIGIAGLIGVNGPIAPEEIDIPRFYRHHRRTTHLSLGSLFKYALR